MFNYSGYTLDQKIQLLNLMEKAWTWWQNIETPRGIIRESPCDLSFEVEDGELYIVLAGMLEDEIGQLQEDIEQQKKAL